MSASLDMSLDDIIKKNKRSESQNASRGNRGRIIGPTRRFPNRPLNRPNPYPIPQDEVQVSQVPNIGWQPGLFMGGESGINTDTKLYISNLDYGVSNEDIRCLFSEIGELKRYSLHYDRSGRSKGTAEVVFMCREHALAAVKRYNSVQLDGKPMKIELVGVNLVTPPFVLPPPVANGCIIENPHGNFTRQGRGNPGFIRGGRGYVRGRGRGRDNIGKTYERKSLQDLDAELDKYRAEAMQAN